MQLTAIEFATLLRDLKCDVRPDERRANPRAPARTRVEVVQIVAGTKNPAPELLRARDISRNGLGLLSPTKLEEGSRMLVLLPKTATESFVLLCEVARVTRLPGDTFGVGVRMMRRITDEEHAAFMRGNADAASALLAPVAAAA